MMQPEDTIVITGAAGFIASFLTGYLNKQGFEKLILVDDFSPVSKMSNLEGKKFLQKIHRLDFFHWLKEKPQTPQYIFHLGARTDTTEMDYAVHEKWNVDYSKKIWKHCVNHRIPLLYASSAATYGDGAFGYKDDHTIVSKLKPLNPYGQSKNDFDQWVLEQNETPPFWAGVKFFNVYGPNEYHKGRMASVIFHAFHQIKKEGSIRLFRSHNSEYDDGGQMRDFVYVEDVVKMCIWLMNQKPENGLYNVGSGKARTFLDLANALFKTMNLPAEIEFIDTPEDIRDKYQYFTEAAMEKIKNAGYADSFYSLEEGIKRYIQNFLAQELYF